MLLQAGVITSDEYVTHLDGLEAEENEKEQKEKKEGGTREKESREEGQARKGTSTMNNGSHCGICRNN